MRPRPIVAAALSLSLLAAACADSDDDVSIVSSGSAGTESGSAATEPTDGGAGSTSSTSSTEGGSNSGDRIDWQDFGDGLESGSLIVPIDYDDPSKGTFDLFILRHPAADPDKRIGTLLVNPGGPGFGGAIYAQAAESVYSEDLIEHFDIVGWDPRGTGLSTPAIDCIADYDKYFAAEFDGLSDEEAKQLSEDLAIEFEQQCENNNGDILGYVGTNNSARDMDAIREALGEDTISYFGFSYGSELGATWATMFPDTVRAAVLDGAADPNADRLEGSLQQNRGFEKSLNTFLAQCSADSSCAFHNDGAAEGAYDALLASLAESPIPSAPGRPDVEPGVATAAVIEAMFTDALWPQLAQALADAQEGDGSGLLALYDAYFYRRPDGTYDNKLEAFQVIRCADAADRLTVAEADAQAPLFEEAAPRLNSETAGGNYFCTFFPESIDPRIEITGNGAGPILVVGTTGDPTTPLESSRSMATSLEQGVFLVVDADQHTGYGVNSCSMSTVDAYLIDLTVPDNGVEC